MSFNLRFTDISNFFPYILSLSLFVKLVTYCFRCISCLQYTLKVLEYFTLTSLIICPRNFTCLLMIAHICLLQYPWALRSLNPKMLLHPPDIVPVCNTPNMHNTYSVSLLLTTMHCLFFITVFVKFFI